MILTNLEAGLAAHHITSTGLVTSNPSGYDGEPQGWTDLLTVVLLPNFIWY